MFNRMMAGWVWASVLILGTGCVVLENAVSGSGGVPEPGTRVFFQKKIKGAYALYRDQLVPVAGNRNSGYPSIIRPMPPGLTRLGGVSASNAYWIEGRVLQVLDTNLVVVGKTVTNASGVVTFPRSCLVSLIGSRPPTEGAGLRLLAVSDGPYTYQDASGSGSLLAYREVAEPSYEEYRQIYERDSQTSAPDPLVSVARATNVPSFVRHPMPMPISREDKPPTLAPPAPAPSVLPQPVPPSTVGVANGEASRRVLQVGEQSNQPRVSPVNLFAFMVKDGTVTITKYRTPGVNVAARENRGTALSEASRENVIIPGTINGLPVTGIGRSAFQNCTNLASLTVPDSLTTIAENAFRGCSGLTTLKIPRSVTSVWANAFADCARLTSIKVAAANPVYANSEDGVLISKDKSTLVRYPSGREGDYKVPDSVTRIGNEAFCASRALTTIDMAANVTNVGVLAFADCTGLTRVTIPKSVAVLGEKAFAGCSGMGGFFFGGSAPSLNNMVFAGCNKSTVYYTSDTAGWGKDFGGRPIAVWDSKNPFVCVTNKGEITIARYIGLDGNVIVPDRINGLPVKTIGSGAFQNCTYLTSVTLPPTVTSIQFGAFRSCIGLTRVILFPSVASIADQVFNGCSSLTNIVIPPSVISIGANAFINCKNLTSVVVDAANPAYLTEEGIVFNKDKTRLVCFPTGKTGIYAIPNSVTNIGSCAFESCAGLTQVTIPDSVLSIGDGAFRGCTKMAKIALPAHVTGIGKWAFQGCISLTSVTIPDGVIDLGDGAFCNCSGLTRITLPSSVLRIGVSAFAYCNVLTSITVDAANPAYSCSADSVVFSKDKTKLICCSTGKTGSYAIPDSVTNIAFGAFESCSGLTHITIPDSVISIGNNAFKRCGRMTEITISRNATDIGSESFRDCIGLITLTIPATVAQIGDRAFFNCRDLTSIIFKGNVPRLGRDVFQFDTKMTVYHYPGTKDWGKEFGGRPTAVWNP